MDFDTAAERFGLDLYTYEVLARPREARPYRG